MTRVANLIGLLLIAVIAWPMIYVIWISFSPDTFLSPPSESWSLKWYRAFLNDRRWVAALTRSCLCAGIVAVLSVMLTLLAGSGSRLFRGLILLPAALPPALIGLGTFPLFREIGLSGTLIGIMLVHVILCLPVTYLLIERGRTGYLRELQMAARGLGAGPGSVFRRITWPMLRPTIVVALIAAFLLSFHESMATIFLATPKTETLPVVVWPQLKFNATPLVAVASCASILAGILILFCGFGRALIPRRT